MLGLCDGVELVVTMLFTPIYIAMTFIKTWRIRSFRARLLEFLSGNTSVAFCKVPENAAGKSPSRISRKLYHTFVFYKLGTY